jgi:hypothetical protein
MMERHLIAYSILFLFLLTALVLWWRSRRQRRDSDPHLRIDLLGGERGESGGAEP